MWRATEKVSAENADPMKSRLRKQLGTPAKNRVERPSSGSCGVSVGHKDRDTKAADALASVDPSPDTPPIPCRNGERVASVALQRRVLALVADLGVIGTAKLAGCGREGVTRIAARLPVRAGTLALAEMNLGAPDQGR